MHPSGPARVRRRLVTLGVAVAMVWGAGQRSVFAQNPPDLPDAVQKSLADYKLTLEKMEKVSAVIKKLTDAAKTDALIGPEIESVGIEKGDGFDRLNAMYDRNAPHVVEVIKSEGLDAHEFILTMMATVFARLGARARAAGNSEQTPTFVPAANIELAEKNAGKFEDAMTEIFSLNSLGQPAR